MAQLKDTVIQGSLNVTNAIDVGDKPTTRANLELGNAKIFYGTCATAAATVAKVVECDAFTADELVVGALIYVTFENTNSGAVGSLTMNVNGTGAKNIKKHYNYDDPVNLTNAAEIQANNTYLFAYNGTYWVCMSMDYNTNTTPYGIRVYQQDSGYNGDYPFLVSRTAASATIGDGVTNGTYTNNIYGIIWEDRTKTPTLNPSTGVVKLNTLQLTNALPLTYGGTGATNAANARTNLGLGSAATAASTAFATAGHNHDSTYLKLTGGTLSGALGVSIGSNSAIAISLDNTMGNVSLHIATSGNEGVYSNSYWNGSAETASGTWLVYRDTSGNVILPGQATTATKLAAARAINGTNFDGSSDITTTKWGTARTLTIGSKGQSVNGSANVTWSLADIGAAAANHNHDSTYVNVSGDTMTGTLKLASNKYDGTTWGLDASNSDIININGIRTSDAAETFGEGYEFYRSTTTWDAMAAKNGIFYFGSNVAREGTLAGSATLAVGDIDIQKATGQITRDGYSKSWYNGRDAAILRMTSISGYSPFLSIKTTNGSWELGAQNATGNENKLFFTYVLDSKYNAGTNEMAAQATLYPDGAWSQAKGIRDAGDNRVLTFNYSASALGYNDFTLLAAWNGNEQRAVNKNLFATASHTHAYAAATHTHYDTDVKWIQQGTGGAALGVQPIGTLFNDALRANRFAGLNPSGVTIQYSTNGGSSWTNYPSLDDNFKRNLFTDGATLRAVPSGTTINASSQLRITIATGAAGVYTIINRLQFYISTGGSNDCKVTVKCALESSPSNYNHTVCENVVINGWSGWNDIGAGGFVTYGNNAGTQYGRIQMTFTCGSYTGSAAATAGGLNILNIKAFGGYGWTEPCYLAKYDRPYVIGNNQTVHFDYGVYGAVWNDYAEYRAAGHAKPGECVVESATRRMQRSTKRLQPGAHIVSDTFGFAIGQTKIANTPIAVTGRVLAYVAREVTDDDIGAAVCAAPNGKVDIMTREEIREYPERIIGTISEIPNYDIWYAGNENQPNEIKVNGRIWISVR